MGLVHQLVEMNQQLECLERRIAFVRDRMENIRSQGKIAPPLTWIQKYYVQKANGKKYYYYRLLEATNRRSCTGSIQGKVKLYLGNKHSSKYHTYKAAIRRRNELKWLEKRYQQLMNLYEKALTNYLGQGSKEKDRDLLNDDREAKEFKLGDFIPTVAELRANLEQLWYWLNVIAERLGITITGVKENINSVEDVP